MALPRKTLTSAQLKKQVRTMSKTNEQERDEILRTLCVRAWPTRTAQDN